MCSELRHFLAHMVRFGWNGFVLVKEFILSQHNVLNLQSSILNDKETISVHRFSMKVHWTGAFKKHRSDLGLYMELFSFPGSSWCFLIFLFEVGAHIHTHMVLNSIILKIRYMVKYILQLHFEVFCKFLRVIIWYL